MRKTLLCLVTLFVSSGAHAQTTTTNCTGIGYSVQCTSRTQPSVERSQQQNQENLNRAFENLGAAIAADRQRRTAAAAQAEIDAQIAAALATEQSALPPPTDESPVLLTCSVNDQPLSVALYEKHGRADVTSGGATRTRAATFDAGTITWISPVVRSSLSRLDGSYVGYSNLPALQGQVVWKGTCTVATERKF